MATRPRRSDVMTDWMDMAAELSPRRPSNRRTIPMDNIDDVQHNFKDQTTRSGFLGLRLNGCWKQVWISVRHSFLLYFQTRSEMVPLGMIDLTRATILDRPITSTHKSNCFELLIPCSTLIIPAPITSPSSPITVRLSKRQINNKNDNNDITQSHSSNNNNNNTNQPQHTNETIAEEEPQPYHSYTFCATDENSRRIWLKSLKQLQQDLRNTAASDQPLSGQPQNEIVRSCSALSLTAESFQRGTARTLLFSESDANLLRRVPSTKNLRSNSNEMANQVFIEKRAKNTHDDDDVRAMSSSSAHNNATDSIATSQQQDRFATWTGRPKTPGKLRRSIESISHAGLIVGNWRRNSVKSDDGSSKGETSPEVGRYSVQMSSVGKSSILKECYGLSYVSWLEKNQTTEGGKKKSEGKTKIISQKLRNTLRSSKKKTSSAISLTRNDSLASVAMSSRSATSLSASLYESNNNNNNNSMMSRSLKSDIEIKFRRPVLARNCSVWSDFPRVCRNIICYDNQMKEIEFLLLKKQPSINRNTIASSSSSTLLHHNSSSSANSSSRHNSHSYSGNSPINKQLSHSSSSTSGPEELEDDREDRLLRMQGLLQLFAMKVDEDDIAEAVAERFLDEIPLESDVSIRLSDFFKKYVGGANPNNNNNGVPILLSNSPSTTSVLDERKTMRLLKLLSQSMVATPYIHLKNTFAAVEAPIKDATGMWLIEVIFKDNEVCVVHSKSAISADENVKEQFEFVWHMQITLDKQLEHITSADLTISNMKFSDEMKDSRKQKLLSIRDNQLFLLQ